MTTKEVKHFEYWFPKGTRTEREAFELALMYAGNHGYVPDPEPVYPKEVQIILDSIQCTICHLYHDNSFENYNHTKSFPKWIEQALRKIREDA